MNGGQVVPISRGEAPAPDALEIARPFLRIPAGIYEGRSVTLRRRRAFKRDYIEAWFDVFEGPAVNGRVLARVPAFFRLTGRTLAPSSALARWIQLLGISGRRDRIPLRALRDKLWLVEVRDVTMSHGKGLDGKPRPLPQSLIYSKVAAISERLT